MSLENHSICPKLYLELQSKYLNRRDNFEQ